MPIGEFIGDLASILINPAGKTKGNLTLTVCHRGGPCVIFITAEELQNSKSYIRLEFEAKQVYKISPNLLPRSEVYYVISRVRDNSFRVIYCSCRIKNPNPCWPEFTI